MQVSINKAGWDHARMTVCVVSRSMVNNSRFKLSFSIRSQSLYHPCKVGVGRCTKRTCSCDRGGFHSTRRKQSSTKCTIRKHGLVNCGSIHLFQKVIIEIANASCQ